VIKTHAAFEDIPYSPRAKYILVVRDPKDVFVSSYGFLKGAALGPLMPSPGAWLEFFLDPSFVARNWADHTASYWAAAKRENVLFLTFKEMKTDLDGCIRRIADLIGEDLTSEEFSLICERSRFEYMRTIDRKFAPGKMNAFSGPDTPLVRRGRQGGSSEMLSTQQQRRIDAAFQRRLAELGSDFDWDLACSPVDES
jgi:hypothetical protein